MFFFFLIYVAVRISAGAFQNKHINFVDKLGSVQKIKRFKNHKNQSPLEV